MTKYKYLPFPTSTGRLYKPIILVSLGYNKTNKITSELHSLIDSGSDVSFCSLDIGIWLGIDFAKGSRQTFTTANMSKMIAIKKNVTIYTQDKKYTCFFHFTDQLPASAPVVLGQIGFFDHHKVTFDWKKKEIEVV